MKNLKTNKGFSIIELIIAIFILSVAVVGIFGAFSVMSILTSTAANRLTATFLAQEGVEVARNIRDNNWLNMNNGIPGAAWLDGLDICYDSSGCEVDYTKNSMSAWAENYLSINANGFYVYDSNSPPTKFKRRVIITCYPFNCSEPGNYIAKVSVRVSWDEKANILHKDKVNAASCSQSGGLSNCIVVEDTLYNWY